MLKANRKVVCVDASTCPRWGKLTLVKGRVYTAIHTSYDINNDEQIVLLGEDKSPHPTGYYRAARFRPAVERKTSIEIFQAMLTPSPVTVDAMKLADHAREIVR